MEMVSVKSAITLIAVLFTISITYASFMTITPQVITEFENCEYESEYVGNCVVCNECQEYVPILYSDPVRIDPTTILRPYEVEAYDSKVVEIKDVQVITNTKFGDVYCGDCDEGVIIREYSEPTRIQRTSVMNTIEQFIYDCFFY